MRKKILVSFRVEEDLWKKFGRKTKRYGSNRSKMLRTMIRYFVGEKEGRDWVFINEGR